MIASPQEKTGKPTKTMPVPQSSHNANQPIGRDDATARLLALQRQFASFGLSVHQLTGDELAVTGVGSPGHALPDARSAWLYLRQLRGGAE